MSYLPNTIRQFKYYKVLAEKAMAQCSEAHLHWNAGQDEANSIAVTVKHMHGNMLSRWTDFLTTDGEKEWRNRDGEFIAGNPQRAIIMRWWEEGWDCLLNTLDSLTEADLEKTIYIRKQPQSVMDAINRQLAHYAYHAGQIVTLVKLQLGADWKSLSIPKNGSADFNRKKFFDDNQLHYTDDILRESEETDHSEMIDQRILGFLSGSGNKTERQKVKDLLETDPIWQERLALIKLTQ